MFIKINNIFLQKVKQKNDILPFIFSFFADFMFYYSFYVSLFSKIGFSGSKLATLFVVMNISKMLTDIPVGVLSDTISRRNVLIFGLLFRIGFCFLCLFGKNFYIFILAVSLLGCGNSCIWTHTWNYFYDYKKNKGDTTNFSNFMGKFYAISNTAIALAGFTGSFIFTKIDFFGIFIGSIVSMCVAIIIMLNLPNYQPMQTKKTATSLGVDKPTHFLTLLRILLKKPKIIRLLLLTILADTMFIVFLDMNTTLMNITGFEPNKISQIVSIVAFVRIFSNYFSGKTEKFMSFKKMHSILLVLMVVSVCVSLKSSIWIIFSVSFYLCIYPFFDTSIKTKIEHKLDTNTRATVMSLASLFVSIFAVIFNSIIGFVAEENGYFASPVCIFLIVMLVLFVVRNITMFYRVDKNIRDFIKK